VSSRLRGLLARAEALAELSPEGKVVALRRLIRLLLQGEHVDVQDYPEPIGRAAGQFARLAFEMLSRRPIPPGGVGPADAIERRAAMLREVLGDDWPRTWSQGFADKATRCAKFFALAQDSVEGNPNGLADLTDEENETRIRLVAGGAP
jgi:hypothetical protein